VPDARRSRPLRHETLAAAFIVVLLVIAVGTAMRAWWVPRRAGLARSYLINHDRWRHRGRFGAQSL